jgi:PHD/YefM family antitoxin component YafN of YafNO toxin-antitoxin module
MFFKKFAMTRLIRETAKVIDAAQDEPVFITRTGGKAGAVIVSEAMFKRAYDKHGLAFEK